MFYKNSYLEKMADVLQRKDVEVLIKQLTDENEIIKMFEQDANYIIQKYNEGAITLEEARRNFEMLKAYVLTQLKYHFEKAKELARHFGVKCELKVIEDTVIEDLVEMLENREGEIR